MNILTKAMLVKLSISQFNPRRQDARMTSKVLSDQQAKKSAGVWMKNLIDPEKLEGISRLSMSARQDHYRLSLPWQDEGWRILPSTMFIKYQDKMRQNRNKYDQAVELFLSHYPQYVEEARAALNGMFNPNDYPTLTAVKGKFGFNVDVSPLPSGSDFRVTLASEELEKLQANVDQRVQDATAAAMRDLWQRLADPVKHMAECLKQPDKIFRDSLVENVKEILDIVPGLNVVEDSRLTDMTREIKEKLSKVSPDALRVNKTYRQETAETAEDLLTRMKDYIR